MRAIHEQLVAAAHEAARLADGVMPSQSGDTTPCSTYDVRTLMAHLMQEIVLHAWDLAVATGQTPRFPDDVSATVMAFLERTEDPMREEDWYAAPALTASSSLLDQAVAKSGRDPSWRPTTHE